MYNSTGYNAYRTNSAMTASPQELTLMLYNGAIKFCNLAIEGIENRDMQSAHKYNLRAQDIINELKITLDHKYEIAKEMDVLYTYILELLRDGNIQKDTQKIADAKRFITEFRDTWQEVIKK